MLSPTPEQEFNTFVDQFDPQIYIYIYRIRETRHEEATRRCNVSLDVIRLLIVGRDPTPSSSLVTSQPTPPCPFPFQSVRLKRRGIRRNLLRLPSGATLVGSMVHWPRSRSYFFLLFLFPFLFPFPPPSLLFLPLLLLFCGAPFDSRKYHVSAAKKKKKEKSRRIHIQIVTDRGCILFTRGRLEPE